MLRRMRSTANRRRQRWCFVLSLVIPSIDVLVIFLHLLTFYIDVQPLHVPVFNLVKVDFALRDF